MFMVSSTVVHQLLPNHHRTKVTLCQVYPRYTAAGFVMSRHSLTDTLGLDAR